jgi:DNA-binding transcriptional MerR regulator
MLIAELERRSGLSRDTIRYYERLGLITPPRRGDNGYRHYDERTLVELTFITKAQEVGFSLQQIKPGIRHLHAPSGHCGELIASLQVKEQEIGQRIEQDKVRLVRLRKIIRRLQDGGGSSQPPSKGKR